MGLNNGDSLQDSTFDLCCTGGRAPVPAPTLAPVMPTLAPIVGPPPNTIGPDINTVLSVFTFTETLRAALDLTNLTPALEEPNGPFTLFAPTEDAFGKLPAGTLETLVQPANLGTLEDILLYHVAPGRFRVEDLADGQQIETLLGPTVEVTISVDSDRRHRHLAVPGNDPGLKLNGSTRIVFANIGASNGLVHVIDEVLIPPQ